MVQYNANTISAHRIRFPREGQHAMLLLEMMANKVLKIWEVDMEEEHFVVVFKEPGDAIETMQYINVNLPVEAVEEFNGMAVSISGKEAKQFLDEFDDAIFHHDKTRIRQCMEDEKKIDWDTLALHYGNQCDEFMILAKRILNV